MSKKVEEKRVIRESLTEVAGEVKEMREEVKAEREEAKEEAKAEVKEEVAEAIGGAQPKPEEVDLDSITIHYHGGKGVRINSKQRAKLTALQDKVQEALRGRNLGDIPPSDPYYQAQSELDSFITSLES